MTELGNIPVDPPVHSNLFEVSLIVVRKGTVSYREPERRNTTSSMKSHLNSKINTYAFSNNNYGQKTEFSIIRKKIEFNTESHYDKSVDLILC